MKEEIQRGRSRGGHRSFHPMPRQLPYRPLVPSLQPSLVGKTVYLPGSDVSAQISSGCPIFTDFMTLSLKMSMTSENWSKIAGVSLIRPTTCRKNIVYLLTAYG